MPVTSVVFVGLFLLAIGLITGRLLTQLRVDAVTRAKENAAAQAKAQAERKPKPTILPWLGREWTCPKCLCTWEPGRQNYCECDAAEGGHFHDTCCGTDYKPDRKPKWRKGVGCGFTVIIRAADTAPKRKASTQDPLPASVPLPDPLKPGQTPASAATGHPQAPRPGAAAGPKTVTLDPSAGPAVAQDAPKTSAAPKPDA